LEREASRHREVQRAISARPAIGPPGRVGVEELARSEKRERRRARRRYRLIRQQPHGDQQREGDRGLDAARRDDENAGRAIEQRRSGIPRQSIHDPGITIQSQGQRRRSVRQQVDPQQLRGGEW